MARRYPQEVHDFIHANCAGRSHADLAELTNATCGTSFTAKSMMAYLANHKLRTNSIHNPRGSKLFPPEVASFFREHNKGRSAAEMAQLINDTFKAFYTVEQIKAYRARNHLDSGLTGRFEKGHTPSNKGKKTGSYPGMVPTQFKKGHLPHNHLPVGSERTNRDGYRERKIQEPNVWRAVHVLNWEAVHGPVPAGHVLIFKNGDKANYDVSNLLLVTRGELARMNQRGLISEDPESTEAGQNIARLILATAKKKKELKKRCYKKV